MAYHKAKIREIWGSGSVGSYMVSLYPVELKVILGSFYALAKFYHYRLCDMTNGAIHYS